MLVRTMIPELYLKGTSAQVFFNLLNHTWVLEQNLYFCRTHFDGYFSYSTLELQTEMELKPLPSFVPSFLPSFLNYLLTHLLCPSSHLNHFEYIYRLKILQQSPSLCYPIVSYCILYDTIKH